MTTTPQAALLSAQNPLLKRCYTMSESHLSGYRVVIGFERLEDAQDAHEYIAKLQATQEPVQAGKLPPLPETLYQLYYEWPDDEDGCGGSEVVDGDAYTADQMHSYARAALSARKPLNSAQIRGMAIQEQFFLVCDSMEDLTCIVREVERAHGIGMEVKP